VDFKSAGKPIISAGIVVDPGTVKLDVIRSETPGSLIVNFLLTDLDGFISSKAALISPIIPAIIAPVVSPVIAPVIASNWGSTGAFEASTGIPKDVKCIAFGPTVLVSDLDDGSTTVAWVSN